MIKAINFTNVNPITLDEKNKIQKDINKIIKDNDFILGKSLKVFENNFAKLSKVKYATGCASGTDALLLALLSLNLKRDDEVIVPAMTYISTGLSVLLNNNKLILADIDKHTGLISINDILKKITKKTKAIIPVNLYGQKVNLKKLRESVNKRIFIIEDSAQSHFAYSCYNCPKGFKTKCCQKERNDKYADLSCYSFYPAKNLGAYGDGGLITTNNAKLHKKLLALRNLGAVKKHVHKHIGLNSRLDTLQATILNNKLSTILKLNNHRRKICEFYDKNLKEISQIKITKTNPGSSRHLYVIRTKKRDKLIKYLASRKIFCQIHYPYTLGNLKPFIKKIKKNNNLYESKLWSKECLSLPLYPNMKRNDLHRIISEIYKFYNQHL